MAVPGLFAPLEVDGRTLVDGGLVSNLSVQLARDMGVDIVIAVNLGSDLQRPEALASPAAVTQQRITILVGQNVCAQKALLHRSDVRLEPCLPGLSFPAFAKGPQGVHAGEAGSPVAAGLRGLSRGTPPAGQARLGLAHRRAPVFGVSAEAGNVGQLRDNFGRGAYLRSGSLFVGGNSPIGPLYFGFAAAPQGVWNVYLQLGRVF